jgi:peptidyl-prolyl cis-trans isomerase C
MKEATTRTNRFVSASLGCLLVLLIVVGFACRKQEGPAPEPSTPEPSTAAQPQTPPTTETPAPSPTVVTVNGEPITEAQLEERITYHMRSSPQMANLPPQFMSTIKAQMRPRVLDAMISRSLLLQAAKEAGVTVTDAEVMATLEQRGAAQEPPISMEQLKQIIESRGGSFEQVKADFKEGLTLEKFMEGKMAGKTDVTDEEARARYDEEPARFEEPEQVRASHILIGHSASADPNSDPNKARAEGLLKQIREGADFAELARANSIDRGSRVNGGDLGFFSRGDMVAPFEAAAFGLEPNAVSDLVESRYGYHIIKATGHKDARTVPFEEAKPILVAEVKDEKQSALVEAYVQSLKEKASIVYSPGSEPAAPMPAPMSVTPAPAASVPPSVPPTVPADSIAPAEPNTN